MSGVSLTGIRKTYGVRTVLKQIDMELSQGELVCLLGPSGCGKTTLLRILAGFETPDHGQVMLNGQDVTHLPPNKRRMGMVFQAYSLFPNMTALQNVRFGPRVRGLGDTKAQLADAERLLGMVGLAAHIHKFPHQMSGGQQQRVALARALAVKPDILLLDEPLSALDAKVRAQLRSEIRRIQQETGITTVFVTHDQEEALSISDRVAVMSEGHVLQMAPPAEIYRTPADGFVARFIGAGGVLAGIADGAGVRVGNTYVTAYAASQHVTGSAVELFLRPEHVLLTARNLPAPAGAVTATVHEVTFFGSLTRIKLGLDDGDAGEIWADLPSDNAGHFAIGMPVWASWAPESPRVLARQ
ncbi:ABC transporter ATP-binding protein [Acidisoma cellulosilytica]|uniref:ABC transporter ATP-binding protein n=2 Tax=Acidisoma cellulosilyticum TaxID=2802395 RepID=A0A963YWV0_9PROT|nr:ABC transporter ATP-binding protein [Acidisoma cellulosilyticum]